MNPAQKRNETDSAYLAGLLDASARVLIRRHKRGPKEYAVICLRLARVHPDVLAWLREHFPDFAVCGKFSPPHEVEYVTHSAAALLVHAHPFLRRLRPYAQLVYRFARTVTKPGVRLTAQASFARAQIAEDLQKLRRTEHWSLA